MGFLTVLVLLGGCVTVGCYVASRKGSTIAKIISILAGVTTAMACIVILLLRLSGAGKEDGKGDAFTPVATHTKVMQTALGHVMGGRYAGKHVLLVTEPLPGTPEAVEAEKTMTLKHFREGVAERFSKFEHYSKPATGAQPQFYYTAEDVDTIAEKYPNAQVIMLWGQIPEDLEDSAMLREKERPLLVFGATSVPAGFSKFIEYEYVDALLTQMPRSGMGVITEEPKDYDSLCRKWLLITDKTNLADVKSEFPNYFAEAE